MSLLKNLIDDVLLPTEKYIRNNLKKNNPLEYLKKYGIFQLAVAPFTKKISIDELQKNVKYDEYNKKIYDYFFSKLNDFLNKLENETINVNNNEFDDFLDFSDEQDETINDFHYEEYEKIDAKEYMSKCDLDEEVLNEIVDAIDRYSYIKNGFETLEEGYIDEIKAIIAPFIDLFELSLEFHKVAIIFYQLITILEELVLEKLSEEKKKFLKIYLNAIIEDLVNFYYEIIRDKSAKDIHYMDASFLANVLQIETILKE